MNNNNNNYIIPDLDGELWEPIQGYNNKYFISNYGRIKSYKYHKPLLKKISVNSKGYYRVELWKNGKRTMQSVARLVGQAFIPNDDPIHKTTIDHINGDKSLNTVDNLQWLSLSDNIKAYYKNKTKAASSEVHNKT